MAASTHEPLLAGPGFDGNRLSDSSRAASPLTSLGFSITLLYVVLLVGRVAEITSIYLGSSFYQILILTVVLMALLVISGGLIQVGSHRVGTIWIALHLWVIFTIPFSGYRRGSIDTLQAVFIVMPAMLFVGAFFLRDRESVRKGLWSMAWAGIVGLIDILAGSTAEDNRLVSNGTFGNSNFLAIYLLMMLPVWGFIAANARYAWVVRIAFSGAMVLAVVSILKTGSRGGLLTLLILLAILFFSVSLANKAKLIVVAAMSVVLLLGVLPSATRNRLATLFTAPPTEEAQTDATTSSEARMALLKDSISSTFKHPLTGAGLGVSSVVIAGEKLSRGERTSWQVTHNMYTEVSSELGIPGFLLYIAGIFSAIKALWQVRRAGSIHPELRELKSIANTFIYCWLVFLINGIFTSMALDYWIYVLIGFSIATSIVAEDLVRQKAYAAMPQQAATPRSTRFFPAAQPIAPMPLPDSSGARNALPALKGVAKYLDAPWRRNPRKHPPGPGAHAR